MHRRRFLQLTAGALTAAPFLDGCVPAAPPVEQTPAGPPALDPQQWDAGTVVRFAPDTVPLDEELFALAVQAGSMRADDSGASLRMWTHIESPVERLRLRVWREGTVADEVVLVRDQRVTADEHGYVELELSGLAPSTWYHYAFFVESSGGRQPSLPAMLTRRSHIGRVRTAWATDWLWPVTLGATSCTNHEHEPFDALSRLAEQELDAFVHLGDMVYADGSRTREEYRTFWRRALMDPGYRALLPRQGSYLVWDDHELVNNLDPETVDPAQLQAAQDEFYANLPMTTGPGGGLWQSFTWGRTLELFALDCRSERRPSTRNTATPLYIGAEQMAWLKDGLKNSRAHFKVILNSVPITLMPDLWAMSGDRWQGYHAQREELLAFLEVEGIDGVWFLSGDFHMGFVSRVEPTGYRSTIFEAAVGPGGNLGNPLGYLASQEEYRESVFPSDQFFYGEGSLAATTLTFDPLRSLVRVRYLGVDGAVLFDRELG